MGIDASQTSPAPALDTSSSPRLTSNNGWNPYRHLQISSIRSVVIFIIRGRVRATSTFVTMPPTDNAGVGLTSEVDVLRTLDSETFPILQEFSSPRILLPKCCGKTQAVRSCEYIRSAPFFFLSQVGEVGPTSGSIFERILRLGTTYDASAPGPPRI